MMFRRRLFAASIALGLATPSLSPVEAGPILMLNSDAKGGVGQLETLTWTFQGAATTGLAGTIATSPASGGTAYDTYCIDLYHDFRVGGGGTSWETEVLPISAFRGDAGVNSPDNPGGNAGAIGYLYSTFAGGVSSAVEGAALQVAIWKVDYDNSNSFSTGSFRFAATAGDPTTVQSLVFAQATRYLAGFDGTQSSNEASYLRATSHPNGLYQDLVGPSGSFGPAVGVVPEPASLVSCLVGLGLVAASVRRRGAASRA